MKTLSPFADKLLSVLAAALVIFFLVRIGAQTLVEALNPVKPPLMEMTLVGIVGLILCFIALTWHKLAYGRVKRPKWLALATIVFLLMGMGGYIANALIR